MPPETSPTELAVQLSTWKDEEGSLILILHEIENQPGHVPRKVAMEVSSALGAKHENPAAERLGGEFLGRPLSDKACALLHPRDAARPLYQR